VTQPTVQEGFAVAELLQFGKSIATPVKSDFD
jgi:hypothetical protein